MKSIFDIIAWAGLAVFAVYLGARLITAAYFNSKHHYERRKQNHGQPRA